MPPKRLWISLASKSSRPFAGAAVAAVGVPGSSVTEDHLLPLAEHALRPERHQQDQDQAEEDEPQRGDLRLRQRQLEEAQPLEHRPDDDRADRHPPVVGQAAEHQHHVADEGDQGLELVGDDELRG